MLGRNFFLALAGNRSIERWVRRTPWSARAARRFVAGESILEAIQSVQSLNVEGLSASLDLLGESVTSTAQVEATVQAYEGVFEAIRTASLDANVSLKLTALGLDVDEELCYRNLDSLLRKAEGIFVRIDMEGSSYTDRTLNLFYRLWNSPEQFRNVGVVIQSCLRRSEADVRRLDQDGVRVRLCKGAYYEPPTVAFAKKSEVDANYIALMRLLLRGQGYTGIATHDERMIEATVDFVRSEGIPHDQFEFQMLYGIRRDLQLKLLSDGWRVRVYTPFGDHWYPYFMRRLAERPANVWFVLKNAMRR